MMKVIAAVLMLAFSVNAGAACTPMGTSPVILIPNFSDPGPVWAACLKYDFQIMQSSGVFSGLGSSLVTGYLSASSATFTNGVDVSSLTTHITGAAQFAVNASTGIEVPALAPICWGTPIDSTHCQYAPAASVSLSATPTWTKYTVTYANFAAASTTSSSTLVSVAAGTVIHGVKIKHSTAFAGSGITAYTVSVGTGPGVDSNSMYASAYDVFQVVTSSAMQISQVYSVEGGTAPWTIGAFATSAGANLNAAAGVGSVDIWILSSITP